MPSWDQISGLIQRLLMFAGGFAVAKGWISEQLMVQIVGALVGVGGVLWGVHNNTQTSLIASVQAIPEVQGVITTNNIAGRALAQSIPSDSVQSAGSAQAKTVANSPTPAPA